MQEDVSKKSSNMSGTILGFVDNFISISFDIARKIQAISQWDSLVTPIPSMIIQHCLTDFNLWGQLIDYKSSETTKLMFWPPLREQERIFSQQNAFKPEESPTDLEVPDSFKPRGTHSFNLDHWLLSASSSARIEIQNYLLFEKDDSSSIHLNDSKNRLKLKTNGKAVVHSRFNVGDDYDSEEDTVEKNIETFPDKPDLVKEILSLEFKETLFKEAKKKARIDNIFYDVSLNRAVVEEQEYLDKLNSEVAILKAQLEESQNKKTSWSSFKDIAGLEATQVETPKSPLFNCAHGPFKNFLNVLQNRKEELDLSKEEIEGLVKECGGEEYILSSELYVRKQLYRSLALIIHNLMDLKEHNQPFMFPVSKKSGPDYLRKVARPMDLVTISKKVKNRKYATKEEFIEDVRIMFSNYRTFNPGKGSGQTVHADFIEDFAESQIQEILLNSDRSALANTSNQRVYSDYSKDPEETNSSENNDAAYSNSVGNNSSSLQPNVIKAKIQKLESLIASLKTTSMDGFDPSFSLWNSVTREARAENRLLGFAFTETEFENCPAILPELSALQDDYLTLSRNGLDYNDLQSSPSLETLPEIALDLLLPNVPGSSKSTIPSFSNHGDNDRSFEKELSLDNFSVSKIPRNPLTTCMLKNVAELNAAFEMNTKIQLANDFLNDDLSGAHNSETLRQTINFLSTESHPNVEPYLHLTDLTNCRDDEISLDQSTADSMFARTASLVLSHSGFDTADKEALNIFNEIAIERFKLLGKTLSNYFDNYKGVMSPEDMILHSFKECQIGTVDDLNTYVSENVGVYGEKVREAKKQLAEGLNELITRPSGSGVNEEGEFDNGESVDSCMMGNFEDITGEDFFGFKELGLDKELGLNSLSVSAKLLLGHKRMNLSRALKNGTEECLLEYPGPPPFTPITDSSCHIALLQPFLDEKITEGEGAAIEDDSIPNRKVFRPKAPPTGKAIGVLRRKLVDQVAQYEAKMDRRNKEAAERLMQKEAKNRENEEKKKKRKADMIAKLEARNAEKEQRRIVKETQAALRKAEADAKLANRLATGGPSTHSGPINSNTSPPQDLSQLSPSVGNASPYNSNTSPFDSKSPVGHSSSNPSSEQDTTGLEPSSEFQLSHPRPESSSQRPSKVRRRNGAGPSSSRAEDLSSPTSYEDLNLE